MIATCPLNTPHIPSSYGNEQTTKETKAINNSYIYIHISCKCDTNRAGHFTLDAHASRPVACRVHYGPMVVFVCLHITPPHYHHYAGVYDGIELLKCLPSTFSPVCVYDYKSILLIIFHAIDEAVYIQLTKFSCDDCENTCTSSFYHHQIGSMNHLPLFRARSWNTCMCCVSFYVLIYLIVWRSERLRIITGIPLPVRRRLFSFSEKRPRFSVGKLHDDAIKWKHFPRYWPFVRGIHWSSVKSPHKGQWRGALMFSLFCAWINGWVNNRAAGDLRRHCAHCDVVVM